MTPQELKAIKLALEALELCNGAETVEGVVIYTDKEITALEEALAEHAMRETQRLGQEIEPKIGCVNHDCNQCKAQPKQKPVAWAHYDTFKNLGSLTRARFTATLATKNTGACCIALYTHPINQKEFK